MRGGGKAQSFVSVTPESPLADGVCTGPAGTAAVKPLYSTCVNLVN